MATLTEKAPSTTSGSGSDEKSNNAPTAAGLGLPEVVFQDEMNMLEKEASELTLEEARSIIAETIKNRTDPNFNQELLRRAQAALDEKDLSHERAKSLVHDIKLEAALFDDSPYIEVRSVVDNFDDVNTPVNTFRTWFIGMVFVTIGTGVNIFFQARNPPIVLNIFCAQVAAYPCGKFFEKVLPTRKFKTFGHEWSFNPGPFNAKEHMLISIMANVTFSGLVNVYFTDILFVQRLPQYFNQNETGSKAGYQFLLSLSSQLIGFSLAGLSRRFLIYPPAMIWPATLANIALNKSFHEDKNLPANGWTISRLNWFMRIFLGYGMWFVIPYAVFTALEYFNWMTWIAPMNVKLALITGSLTGLGINPIPTLDFNYMFGINQPMITPLFATMNLLGGAALLAVPMAAGLYFTNTWYTAYLPINTTGLFTRTASSYRVSRVMNPDFTLNEEAYARIGPAYATAGYQVGFFSFFAVYTSTLVHTGLYYHKELLDGFKAIWGKHSSRHAYNDVHNRIMRNYKEVPEWWFGLVLLINLIFAIIAIEIYDTKMPDWVADLVTAVWALFFCVALALVFLIPVGVIGAVTNIAITMNVVTEVIAGYALPGRPEGFMIFKMFGLVVSAQALQYAQDMKLGHYLHIAPRTTFFGQLIPSTWAVFVGLGVANWQIKNIDGICTSAQVNGFTCPGYSSFFNSAIQWGTIGPARLYSHGQLYYPIVYGFLVGAMAPFFVYFLTRRYPNSWLKYINTPAFFFGGIMAGAPYNLSFVWSGVPLAIYAMWYLKTRKPAWWTKYNYVTSSAITSAYSLFGVLWFFAILYKHYDPVWWGNTVSYSGCDAAGCPLLEVDPNIGYFGPPLAGEL